MLTKKIEDALNAQINAELWSAYLYLSMSVYFDADGKPGMANWFKIQFAEEQEHAFRLMNYIVDRGGKVDLKPIDKVEKEWKSPLDAFEETLRHEKVVTGLIHNLAALAKSENDFATDNFLRWFIDEQVEEEATASSMVDALRLIGDNGMGIYTFDKELASRAHTPIED